MKIIDNIKSPYDLQNYNYKQLDQLSQEIREFLISVISKTGGHLSSNLGVVELSIALHKAFKMPHDKVFFDCGHQSYTHKILTGRKDKMHTMGQIDGIIGFQDINESEFDVFSTGHTSNAISAAMGMAVGRENDNDYHIVPVVGDGSLTGGLALEALLNIHNFNKKIIIVLNDNGMSISSNKTAVSKFRASGQYRLVKNTGRVSKKIPIIGNILYSSAKLTKDIIKGATVGNNFFESMGIKYIGIIDGHNIKALEKAFEDAKQTEESVIVHVLTTKGKGYEKAEEDVSGSYHGVSKFDSSLGLISSIDLTMQSWSKVIADQVQLFMDGNNKINVITPAMMKGSALQGIADKYPDRIFDVGIAEGHALSFASGMSLNGVIPFVSIYSTFLQRGYDQLVHDIARLDQRMVIGIDRAGLSGTSGPTHHGLFDIAMIRDIPNFVLCQPRNMQEAHDLLSLGFKHKGPFAIRYPKGAIKTVKLENNKIELGSWPKLHSVPAHKFNIITLGEAGDIMTKMFIAEKTKGNIYDGRFIKPIDTNLIEKLVKENKPIFVYEHNMISSGLGNIIKQKLYDLGAKNKFKIYAFPDEFIGHGSDIDLLRKYNLDFDSVMNDINAIIK